MIVNAVQQPWEFALPSGWKRKRLKFNTFMKGRLGWQKLTRDEYADSGPLLVSSEHFTNDEVDWARCNRVTHERFAMAPEIHLHPRDVLFMKDGAAMGKLAYVHELPEPGCLNSHLLVLRPNRTVLLPRFLFYVLKTPSFNGYMVQERKGTTFFGFSQESMGNYPVSLPTQATQRAIADFLDRKTRAIDELIRKKERLIELLQEKRQALITQAVTKGLDPNVPIKNSGIEWIGQIPQHWHCRRLKQIASRVVVGIAQAATHAYADSGVPIVRSTNVRPNRIALDDLLFIEEAFANQLRSKYIYPDDLLTVRTGNAGVTAVVPPALPRCQCFTMLITTLRPPHSPDFFSFQLNSDVGKVHFSLESWGTAQANISVPILQNTPIAVPPPDEQRAILAWIESQSSRFDCATAQAETQLDRLREYRQALISAAVTGQIDVASEVAA